MLHDSPSTGHREIDRSGPATSVTRRLFGALSVAALVSGALVAGTAGATSAAAPAAPAVSDLLPIVFVHGGMGSGSQFDAQARRFASNGYPANYIEALDYNSLLLDQNKVWADLDARIAAVKARTGKNKVELLGHSLGTMVSQGYLKSSAARAANVAHYVNLDGAAATALPGGVPTLNITGGTNTSTITGGTNLRLPDHTHVQVTSSAETFKAAYKFFTGQEPATTNIVAESGTIKLAGRVLNFPSNDAITNATLNIYQVNPATGQRTSQTPIASAALTDGTFGPFNGSGSAHYEFAVVYPDGAAHHIYYQPFLRTNLGIRLLTTRPGTGISAILDKTTAHVNALVYRNKEWWADQGANSDTLTINGTSVLNATTAPKSKLACGFFLYDSWKDKKNNLTTTPLLFGILPFVTSTDMYIPAAANASGTVVFESKQRGGGGKVDRIATPNWPSDKNSVTVNFNDYVNK